MEALDFSKTRNTAPATTQYDPSKYEDDDVSGYLDSDEEVDLEKQSTFFNKWMGKVKNIVGDKTITKEDIADVIG